MANKAAGLVGPFRAGSQVYDPISPEPSVPVGYTRRLTNIATANMGEGSIFQGKTIENEMSVHLPDTVTPTGSGGYIDGFLIADPGIVDYYLYSPSTGNYELVSVSLVAPMASYITMGAEFSLDELVSPAEAGGVSFSLVLPAAQSSNLQSSMATGVSLALQVAAANSSVTPSSNAGSVSFSMGLPVATVSGVESTQVNSVNLRLVTYEAVSVSLSGYYFTSTNKIIFIRG